jgi:hypothetical protein
VVGFIIESPLAEDHGSTRVLASLHHVGEVGLFHLNQLLVLLGSLDLKSVLGLGFGGLEWAGQDAHLGVLDFLYHLGMREVLVDDDSFDHSSVFEGASRLGNDLDEIEVDVLSLQIGNMKYRLHGDVGVKVLALAHDLGAEGGLGALSEEFVIVFLDVDFLLDFLHFLDSDVTSFLETISNLEWMDSFVQKFLGLVEDGSSEYNNTGGTISNLIILRS